MTRFVSLLAIASAGCLCATVAMADSCHGPNAPASFPEPATATEQDILAAQQSVKQYLSDMETTLKCFDAAHNDNAHNTAVDDMQKVATKFNTVLRAYKARQKA
ncbi:MAG: hypothetical protein WBF89_06575 [Steroidobacteraceae bacterium]|jgi:hypothetical protein